MAVVQIAQPETILRWPRAGFRSFWRRKCRKRAGRPRIDRELRELIRRMSMENSLWGASRIHGELLMLVSKSLSRWCRNTCKPPSQTWKTFLRNHAEAIAAIDICVEPISKSFEEDDEAGNLHEAKEVLRIKLPADKNAALPLNPGEEPFDQPASGISPKSASILRGALAAIGSVQCDHLDTGG